MLFYYINSLEDEQAALDIFVKSYTQGMDSTLQILKIYQEFLKTNNQMIEKVTNNFVEAIEKSNMNAQVSFLLGVLTGYKKAQVEKSLAIIPDKREPADFIM